MRCTNSPCKSIVTIDTLEDNISNKCQYTLLEADGNIPAMRYSTPQVSRRNFLTNQRTPSLNSARGERSSRVLSLTEKSVFQMEAQVLFIVSSNGAEQDEEEEATFGNLSSFSDLSASPTSCNSPTGQCSLPQKFVAQYPGGS